MSEELRDEFKLEMVKIPEGSFTMGSPESEEGRYEDEQPQHNVKIKSFLMGRYPITQGQWRVIAEKEELKVELDLNPSPSRFTEAYQEEGEKAISRWQRPVERVNWYEAVEFCARLSKITGKEYRLPSEAEWEYACRGQTKPLDLEKGESYPPFYFGETITTELANYNGTYTYQDEAIGIYREETTPVGKFPPNGFGLYDLHGNVWEWCEDDWHENYEKAPSDGRAWREENSNHKVARGGSWDRRPWDCRSAIRVCDNARDGVNYVGLRIVCSVGRIT